SRLWPRSGLDQFDDTDARVARLAGIVQPDEGAAPALLQFDTQLVEVLPGVNTGVVAVAEVQRQRVVTGSDDFRHAHAFLAVLQDLLAGAMAAHLRTGREDTQVLAAEAVLGAIRPGQGQAAVA